MKARKKSTSTLKLAAAPGVLIAALYLLFYYESQTVQKMSFRPDNADIVQHGKTLYSQYCAECHGDDLEGQSGWKEKKPFQRRRAPPLDTTGKAWMHADKTLFLMTKFGVHALEGKGTSKSDMPAFEDTLEDEEIVAVLSYIESVWAPSNKGKTEVRSKTK